MPKNMQLLRVGARIQPQAGRMLKPLPTWHVLLLKACTKDRQRALRGARLCRELATTRGLSLRISAEEEREEVPHFLSSHSVPGMTPGALRRHLH